MKINVAELKSKILSKQYTLDKFSKKIGIHRGTFYRKINGGESAFTLPEIWAIIENLELTDQETIKIFLSA